MDADLLARKLRENGHAAPGGGLFCDEAGLEFLLGVKRRTLRQWRAENRGPPATLVGRWLYDLEAVARWLAAGGAVKTRRPDSAEGGEERRDAAAGAVAITPTARCNSETR